MQPIRNTARCQKSFRSSREWCQYFRSNAMSLVEVPWSTGGQRDAGRTRRHCR